jgi:hypothetical protein
MSIDQRLVNEREYLRQRIEIIAQQLTKTDAQFVYAGSGKVDLSDESDPGVSEQTRSLRRELRVLQHLQRRTAEGQVVKAARDWRHSLGVRLRQHRKEIARELDANDTWRQLPPHQRAKIPQPPKPPEFWVTDRYGGRWLINNRFMGVLDEIIVNLQKWRDSR